MTRETKIGLLVGLAFIIVIGILLSDHLTSSTEPPPATLANAGSHVMQTVNTPGSATAAQAQPVTPPTNVTPTATVPTQGDLTPRPQQQPVQIVQIGPGAGTQGPPITIQSDQSYAQSPLQQERTTPTESPAHPIITLPHTAPEPVAQAEEDSPIITQIPPVNDSLVNVAHRYGETLVGMDDTGRTTTATTPAWAQSRNVSAKEYTAQPGDSVSRMAAQHLGANTKSNRDAIIALNPSLQKDPNKVIVGQTYLIPGSGSGAASMAGGTQPMPQEPPRVQTAAGETIASATEYWYIVKENDSLWKIAQEQLGNPNAVSAIKELNKDTLKNGDLIQVGMKLRLPGRPLAQAD